MDNIVNFKTIAQYNTFFKRETPHPLINIIDFSKVEPTYLTNGHSFDFYTIFLKEVHCGDIKYGRKYYDYQEGTLVFLAPYQVIRIENRSKNHQPQGFGLMFHPDLLHGTALARNIKNYSFFSYEINEALHLSEQERKTIIDCFYKIQNELYLLSDKHSKTLIVSNIELLLNYCMRFYDRQFITRSNTNRDILIKFEKLLDDYFQSNMLKTNGLPSVKHCADTLCISPNYMGDLIKKETGRNTQEHIHLKLIEIAKQKMFEDNKTVSQIAYELGFQYPQYFSRLFKKRIGCTPNEYKNQNSQY